MIEIRGAATEGVIPNDMIFPQPQNPFVRVFEKLANGEDLNPAEALESFRDLYSGEMSSACIGTFLMGLKTKGETPLELTCGVQAALEKAVKVPEILFPHIDIVGTGGDKTFSFNCSSATSLTLAAMGYKVTKHGNRSVSSVLGSADVLEAVGFPLDLPAANIAPELERTNFVFLFAPNYHPAFKNIVAVRKEIGAHTIFNIMGPLLNPTRPTHQLLGVPSIEHLGLMGETLALCGLQRGVVVHGAGGFDEVSPCGTTHVVWIREGWIKKDILDPETVGMSLHNPKDVSVRNKNEALDAFLNTLNGRGNPAMLDMLTLNTAAALMLFEDNLTFLKAVKKAKEAVASGAGGHKFFENNVLKRGG